jgi:hypothetical protein
MVKLQQHTGTPLNVTQQLHMPPASIAHRLCTMLQAVRSSQLQVSLKPSAHFSTLKVQRGTISQLGPVTAVGLPPWGVAKAGTPVPGRPVVRSVVVALDIVELLSPTGITAGGPEVVLPEARPSGLPRMA